MESIAIIGAGIGGLTAAVALKKQGIEADIYEAAPELLPVGAGIVLAANATQLYNSIGLYEEIKEQGQPLSIFGIADLQLNTISNQDVKAISSSYKTDNIAIHRGRLQQVLLSQINSDRLFLSKKLQLLNEYEDHIDLNFEDGTSYNYNMVIGADGINSCVRDQININATFRDAQQACWRGVVKTKGSLFSNDVSKECWGKGKRFGFVFIKEDTIYWFAVISSNLILGREGKQLLLEEFDEAHPFIKKLIADTPESTILRNDLKDFKPINHWYSGRAVLLGDAAHATTPNMGQGACQAIEDAFVLAKCINEKGRLEDAFKYYQQKRIKKAQWIVNNSWRVGKAAHWQNNMAIALRNFLIKHAPSRKMDAQLRKIYNIEDF